MSLAKKNEGMKIVTFVTIALIIQGIIFYGIYQKMLSRVNKSYINQNTAIIGEVSKISPELTDKIVPIITGKESGDYKVGQSIMKKYSYDDTLLVNQNPLFINATKSFNLEFIGFEVMGIIIIIFGVMMIMKPLFKEINYLNIRAENIVENKKYNKDSKYNGSLDKFLVKFDMMEERIQSSISSLQDEKINLKNIINDISHQLKTPLTALSMYNEILNDHKQMEDEEVDDFINLSKEQLDRMEWLVKTLLKYARLESNVVEYDKKNISLNETIYEAISPLIIKSNEKNQTLIFKESREINYYHDRNWIGESISNIVKNAIEHTDVGGNIIVSLEQTPISITIKIEDNGEGIEKSELKKIFKRFHKGESTVNPTSIGIGLCLSKAIVNSHNGDITVQSEIGKGSTFYITFLKTAKAM